MIDSKQLAELTEKSKKKRITSSKENYLKKKERSKNLEITTK
jgi:hypothetical protein